MLTPEAAKRFSTTARELFEIVVGRPETITISKSITQINKTLPLGRLTITTNEPISSHTVWETNTGIMVLGTTDAMHNHNHNAIETIRPGGRRERQFDGKPVRWFNRKRRKQFTLFLEAALKAAQQTFPPEPKARADA